MGQSQSELFVAAAEGNSEEVRRLLDEHHDPNKPNCVGFTPVFGAAQYGQPETLRLLIQDGGEVNGKSKIGHTPFTIAQRDAARGGPRFGRKRGRKLRCRDARVSAAAEVVMVLEEEGAEIPLRVSSASLLAAPLADRNTADRVASGRGTFEQSAFKGTYEDAAVPGTVQEYQVAVRRLLRSFARTKGRAPDSAGTIEEDLQNYVNALTAACPSNTVEEMAEKSWTSKQKLAVADGRYELCSIVNWGLWQDTCCEDVASIIRALNLFCVGPPEPGADRPKKSAPPGKISYRGGGFLPEHRRFFKVGTMFRAPPVVPTSPHKEVAESFARRSKCPEKIIWTFKFPDFCSHVNKITRRAAGVPDEEEWVFTAYSVFEVLKVKWSKGTDAKPHQITLRVFRDNAFQSNVLPCSPWA